jgi:hypothetical protein
VVRPGGGVCADGGAGAGGRDARAGVRRHLTGDHFAPSTSPLPLRSRYFQAAAPLPPPPPGAGRACARPHVV